MAKTGKNKIKVTNLILNIIPLFALLIIFLFTKNEIMASLLLIAVLLVSFKIKYYKNEWKLFFIGFASGLVIELGGDLVYKLQYWEQASLFGIPLWLPIFWGLAFVYIRRFGNLIVKSK